MKREVAVNLSNLEYTVFLRRYILIHSFIYYSLNRNIVSDREYDAKAYELVEYQKDSANQGGRYWEVFHDFDGTTGFDLYSKLSEEEKSRIVNMAYAVMRSANGGTKK